MMRNVLKIGVWIIFVFFVLRQGNAQDIHFSQFNSAPLLLNPALTGVNSGHYRMVANYRTQWTGIAPFRTIAASYDMALAKSKSARIKSNYGGIGMSLFNDKAGDADLSTTQANLNLSYTILLNSKGTQSLSAGLSAGIGHRSINLSKLTFDSQFGSGGFDENLPTRENITNDSKIFADAGAGIVWNYFTGKTTNIYLGTAVSHLTQPNLSFLNDATENLFMKLTLHGGGHFKVANNFYLLPSFMYLNQGPHSQFNIGSLVKWSENFTFKDNTAFYFGGWYRWKDAFILSARVDIAGFNVGFSYDVNISKLSAATSGNGGPELSLVYTGFFKSKKHHGRLCPVL